MISILNTRYENIERDCIQKMSKQREIYENKLKMKLNSQYDYFVEMEFEKRILLIEQNNELKNELNFQKEKIKKVIENYNMLDKQFQDEKIKKIKKEEDEKKKREEKEEKKRKEGEEKEEKKRKKDEKKKEKIQKKEEGKLEKQKNKNKNVPILPITENKKKLYGRKTKNNKQNFIQKYSFFKKIFKGEFF